MDHAAVSSETVAVHERLIIQRLLPIAAAARQRAYAPYSKFQVGAALETVTGDLVSGCNVENISYRLTLCAEQAAIGNAVVQGHRQFRRIVIISPQGVSPCGACRQTLAEFTPDLQIVLVDAARPEQWRIYSLADLLPHSFQTDLLIS